MKISNFDTDKKVLVIAEIGNNHEGSYCLAEEMIGLAGMAGANAVKFQTIIPELLVSSKDEKRFKQLKKYQLSFNEFEKLSKVAKKEKVIFLSTPFDLESAKFLNAIVPAFKIASGDMNFYPLVKLIATFSKPIIFSSGNAPIIQIKKTRDLIKRVWRKKRIKQELAILHCVSQYPTSPDNANLLAIHELKKLKVVIGYSDHTLGIDAAVLSVALGARIIEKHFTVNKDISCFHDHKLSADVKEMTLLVKKIRQAEVLLGDGCFTLQKNEAANRSIVASRNLGKGDLIAFQDIAWLRPGGGLIPGSEKILVGKTLQRAVKKGEMLLEKDVIKKRLN